MNDFFKEDSSEIMHVKLPKMLFTYDSDRAESSKYWGQRKIDCNRLKSELTVRKYRQ